MKTMLNVLGALAAVAGFGTMLAGRGAEGVGLGLSGFVVAAFLFGLARIVALLEAEHAAAQKHRELEVKFWRLQAGKGDPPELP